MLWRQYTVGFQLTNLKVHGSVLSWVKDLTWYLYDMTRLKVFTQRSVLLLKYSVSTSAASLCHRTSFNQENCFPNFSVLLVAVLFLCDGLLCDCIFSLLFWGFFCVCFFFDGAYIYHIVSFFFFILPSGCSCGTHLLQATEGSPVNRRSGGGHISGFRANQVRRVTTAGGGKTALLTLGWEERQPQLSVLLCPILTT